MESFVADLKKDVQCSLCNGTLIEPKILLCFHTLCKLCIKRHAELIEEVNVFNCPECKSDTFLPELSSVEDLKPSLLHSRTIKVLEFVESEKVCSVSESHSTASWVCFDCNRSLCDECEKSHSLFTKDHNLKRSPEFTREDLESMLKKENHCKNHLAHRVDLFCKDCDSVLCMLCLKHDHKDHKTMTLDNLASMEKAVLSKQLEVLEHLKSDDKERQEQKQFAHQIKQDGEKAKKQVKERTKKMIKTLQENERELLRQVDERLDKATRNLNIIDHIPAVEEYINNVMERGLASEMIDIHKTGGSDDLIFSPFSKNCRVIFIPKEGLMQHVNAGFGMIKISCKTDNTMSTIQKGSGLPQALQNTTIYLKTKTSAGKVNDDANDVVDVIFRPEDNVKREKKYVRNNGQIAIEFMAKVPGQLRAEVKVNGNPVSNSPLVMNVKPQQMKVTKCFHMKGIQIESLSGIAVNKDNSRIAVVDDSHIVHVFNSDGARLLTYKCFTKGISFLNEICLVITDSDNDRICIVNVITGTLVKTFGKYGINDGEFYDLEGVHVDDNGNIIVCDRGNHRVQVFTGDGGYQYQFGLTKEDNFDPVSTVTHRGRFYVSDYANNVIHVFEKKDGVLTRVSTIGGAGSDDGQLKEPCGLAIDNDHNLLVCDRGNNRIQKFTSDGRFVGKTHHIVQLYDVSVLNDKKLLCLTRSGIFYAQ